MKPRPITVNPLWEPVHSTWQDLNTAYEQTNTRCRVWDKSDTTRDNQSKYKIKLQPTNRRTRDAEHGTSQTLLGIIGVSIRYNYSLGTDEYEMQSMGQVGHY